jgi:hypothetical protein
MITPRSERDGIGSNAAGGDKPQIFSKVPPTPGLRRRFNMEMTTWMRTDFTPAAQPSLPVPADEKKSWGRGARPGEQLHPFL